MASSLTSVTRQTPTTAVNHTANAGDDSVASPLARQCLRLHLSDEIGPIRFTRVLRAFGSIEAALAAPVGRLVGIRGIGAETAERIARSRDAVDVEAEIERAREHGVRILCCLDAEYPPALKTIADPPPCLYVRGRLEPADAVALAIVGARHCTHYGSEQAERFGALASRAGLTVVSGMARGIDSWAHRGALAAGGRTLAVLGCGLSHIYPPDAADLAEKIMASGALLSELPMNVPPDEKNFPRRNRIIAGLSLGVLVVEAAKRSGALITARLANDYNREVFAVPGRLDSPHADGCNALIQSGEAKLVTHFGDILMELGEVGRTLMVTSGEAEETTSPPTAPVSLDDDERGLLAAFDTEPMSINDLVEAAGRTPARVASLLTMLQLKGAVKRVGGEYFERA
jgi:DNA processing protein